jgi:autotransporter family porin
MRGARGRPVGSGCRNAGCKRATTSAAACVTPLLAFDPARQSKSDRASLLLTTALASTLLAGVFIAPAPAAAQTVTCSGGPGPGPTPILETSTTSPIICTNAEDRTSNGTSPEAIALGTTGDDHFITLDNTGKLIASDDGIDAVTTGDRSSVTVTNGGDITAATYGIVAGTTGANSKVSVTNSGDVSAAGALGIYGLSAGDATGTSGDASVTINNSGDVSADLRGIEARSTGVANGDGSNTSVSILNQGKIAAFTGIYARSEGAAVGANSNAGIAIDNKGEIATTGPGNVGINAGVKGTAMGDGSNTGIAITNSASIHAGTIGIFAITEKTSDAQGAHSNAGIAIHNTGDITIPTAAGPGIFGNTLGDAEGAYSNTGIAIDNAGAITAGVNGISAAAGGNANGQGSNAGIAIHNSGRLNIQGLAPALDARTYGNAGGTGSNTGVAIDNSGDVDTATSGIFALTGGTAAGTNSNAGIAVSNSGDIVSAGTVNAGAIYTATKGAAQGDGSNTGIVIDNRGDLTAKRGGIVAGTFGGAAGANSNNGIVIRNKGAIGAEYGIYTAAKGDATGASSNAGIVIDNAGAITATASGIFAETKGGAGPSANAGIAINNDGNIAAQNLGIYALTFGYAIGAKSNVGVGIDNGGDIAAGLNGIVGRTFGSAIGDDSDAGVAITNRGHIQATGNGIIASTRGGLFGALGANSNVGIVIDNRGDIAAGGIGINANSKGAAVGANSKAGIAITNRGDINAGNFGLYAKSFGSSTGASADAGIAIDNAGALAAGTGIYTRTFGNADGLSSNTGIAVANSGRISAGANGIFALTTGNATGPSSNVGIVINNKGAINAGNVGIYGRTTGAATGAGSNASVVINNSAQVYGGLIGVFMQGNQASVLTNRGAISAGTGLAIRAIDAPATITNEKSGKITGFVQLTDNADSFTNMKGAKFEARKTSDFGDGQDLFVNSGTVHTVAGSATQEMTFFVRLERFDNSGTISLVDGKEGDTFEIANTLGGTGLDFNAAKGSTLAVDAFLGAPGSIADNFIIDGNVTGRTALSVNNTNPGQGALNKQGIPVVFVTGAVNANAFYLPKPVDAGLFDYDLFFKPGPVDQFDLRSFPGGGAHVLPQLLTAAQDIFHSTSETWLDRTADLRVELAGSGVPANLKDGGPAPAGTVTPGVWIKGQGTWLDQSDKASTSAYGRTYNYNLDRNLDFGNVEGGADFGLRGVLGKGDVLVLGVLGGGVFGDLRYNQLARTFDISGGEVGGYATYLNGGLFVDNLFKANFVSFDPSANSGLPGSLDSTTWGFRSDGGYRFGGFRYGAFIEPQATIAVAWTDMNNFTFAGNAVRFNSDADVRGRLGLRVGTNYTTKGGTLFEPFVIGSVWGNWGGNNSATVTSLGTPFGPFTDQGDNGWGVVSAGVNGFSASGRSSAFAKVDVIFGDQTDGISAKGGMRYNW